METMENTMDGKNYVPAEEYYKLECKAKHLEQANDEFEKRLAYAIELPNCRPITVAMALIDMKETFFEDRTLSHGFDKWELRQIAEHLLVYCNGGCKRREEYENESDY